MAGQSYQIEGIDSNQLNDLLFFSAVGGVCPLTPVPNTILMMGVKGALTTAQLKHAKLNPALKNVGSLARGAPMKMTEIAMKTVYYGCCCCIAEQVFKKLCFMFTIKECVENTSKLLHEGWLMAYSTKTGDVTNAVLENKTDVWRVREAILYATDVIDTNPFNQAISKLYGHASHNQNLKDAATLFDSSLRLHGVTSNTAHPDVVDNALSACEQEQRQELKGIMKGIAEMIQHQKPYLTKLEKLYADKLAQLKKEDAQPKAGICG